MSHWSGRVHAVASTVSSKPHVVIYSTLNRDFSATGKECFPSSRRIIMHTGPQAPKLSHLFSVNEVPLHRLPFAQLIFNVKRKQ